MKTFSEEDAGHAFSTMARKRFSDPDAGIKPADVCLFAWLVAEAALVKQNPFTTTASEIFYGHVAEEDGRQIQVAPIGMAFNTVKTSIERLETLGFVRIERQAATRGQRLLVEIVEG